MNQYDYVKALDKLHISPDFNERTAKLMKAALKNRQEHHPFSGKLIFSLAGVVLAVILSAAAFRYGRITPPKNDGNLVVTDSADSNDSDATSSETGQKGITVPLIELPSETANGIKADMIGLFVYQGRIYTQSNTTLVTDENYKMSKEDILNLRGDYLGKTKGSIDEWSKQEDYAKEFASTVGESEVYTVKGYDSKYRLMVYNEYEDEVYCGIYDSFGGQVLNTGTDYFDVLKLRDNTISLQWESFDSWNYGKVERKDKEIDESFLRFIDGLYTSVPEGDKPDMFTENEAFDSQKFIYVRTKDNLITSLRLFKDGYVFAPTAGFFRMDQETFDAFWNSMPVAPEQ